MMVVVQFEIQTGSLGLVLPRGRHAIQLTAGEQKTAHAEDVAR
jgi:hypothetical protein